MNLFPSALICGLMLTVGPQSSTAVEAETGFWNGLGGAFSEMGRNLKNVVTGQLEDPHSPGVGGQVGQRTGSAATNPQQARQLLSEVQYRLGALGYSPGPVDGLMGKKTANAISAFQRSSGLPVDGRPSPLVLDALRSASGSLALPPAIAGRIGTGASDSTSLASSLGVMAGNITKALGSSNGSNRDPQSGAVSLASQLSQSAAGGNSGQSSDGIARALGALAATVAGSNGGKPMHHPAGIDPVQAAAGTVPSSSSAAMISSLAQGVTAARGVPSATQPARPQGQSYLDAMVAEGDAEVYRRARNIDPQTREMARRAGVDIDGMVDRQLAGYEQYKRDSAEIERLNRQDPNFTGTAYPRASGNLPGLATHASQSSSSGPQALPSVLAGSWEGDVMYEPHRISAELPRKYAQHMRVRLDADPQRGLLSVTYPDLGCTGILRANMSVPTKAGVNEHELVDYPLVEQLASNSGKCADGGTVYLSHWAAYQPPPAPRKGQLWFRWVNPATKEPAMHGRLLPVSDVVATIEMDNMAKQADANYVARITQELTGCPTLSTKVNKDRPTADGLLATGWNAQKRTLAEELLNDYDGDLRRINEVANYADMALLAWASYGSEDAFNAAATRGWACVNVFREPPPSESLSDTVAVLFRSSTNRYVLAYRGTQDSGDWRTNLATVSCSDAANAEIESARKIAREAVARYGYVEFTGHSLGGRMAQAACYEIGSKAVVFNSAPLGCNDKQKVQDAQMPLASLVAFRAPQDTLTALSPAARLIKPSVTIALPEDIVVSNIYEARGALVELLRESKDEAVGNLVYKHAMSVLAKAMQEVRLARDDGWINTYMAEQRTQF